MAKKFGDVVQYQMGKVTVNALVVQSNPQPDGEHLVVIFLDPALQSNSMAGSLVDKAVAKAFPAPLTGDKAYGWKDVVSEEDKLPVAVFGVPEDVKAEVAAEQANAKQATENPTSAPTSVSANPATSLTPTSETASSTPTPAKSPAPETNITSTSTFSGDQKRAHPENTVHQ